jgi:hypothetical protein
VVIVRSKIIIKYWVCKLILRMSGPYNYLFKFIIVGDTSLLGDEEISFLDVGKSCLLL